ncbi:LCP family protein [Rhizomonospora bruguierae]|uniref:LCP family protein n=1 Tax=Rhizomonospora bruguierae TaxID=1581705 RepID=UPI001BCEB01D|nr:LCP family protein [Micromonospora sp. NBRC 107566]
MADLDAAAAGTADAPPTPAGGADGPGRDDPAEPTPAEPNEPRRRRWLRALTLVLALALVLVTAGVGGAWYYLRSINSSVGRVDAFTGVPEAERPTREPAAGKAMNLLVLGSDSRDPDSTGGSRADTIMLVHVAADRSGAQIISIPRDTWVTLPDGRSAKINAAFAFGGAPLMVRTVERFTGVRLDHVLLLDFAGFKEIIDALGGIEVQVDVTFTSTHPPFRKFVKGSRQFDGEQALDYARQRYQFKDGDFTRIRHQQQVVLAALSRAADSGLITDPIRLNAFLRAAAKSITVDKTMSLLDTATQLRDLRAGDLIFLTNPSKGTGRVGDQSVVFADPAADKALYRAVNEDAVGEWLAEHPEAVR